MPAVAPRGFENPTHPANNVGICLGMAGKNFREVSPLANTYIVSSIPPLPRGRPSGSASGGVLVGSVKLDALRQQEIRLLERRQATGHVGVELCDIGGEKIAEVAADPIGQFDAAGRTVAERHAGAGMARFQRGDGLHPVLV